ncbi:hypothetical protein MB46_07470 [Arthrobacter alpinus]|uniref:hypothetical protein n=1 Tax=Arthrobacter alpinus TaxID=656366 RepID=UPI0005C94D6C|nr:hypothetical protein [Arthrobacter alpinus]ALV45356.1 hypothetical protein MB46_07470 [Arthrobacter alpinus]
MKRTSFGLIDVLAIPLLVLALGWYYLIAEKIASILFTGFTRDRLWQFCVDELPAGLPPVHEGPLPATESQLVPIRFVCTYAQTVPTVTVVHTDIAGTMIPALPLAAFIVCVVTRWATILRGI